MNAELTAENTLAGRLAERIKARTARVCIVGLGYVGLPLAQTFIRAGYSVLGFDIDSEKVQKLMLGESYIGHIPSEHVREIVKTGRFEATAEAARFGEADAIIICVPTPLTEAREPDQLVPDFSRRARGIEVWAALRHLGRLGLADLIERTCRCAGQFAEGLRAAGYRVLNDVVLNQVLVSFGSSERTLEVIARVQRDGTCWCGGTVWQGHTAMRISVSSWATTEADVERSLAAILRVASAPG